MDFWNHLTKHAHRVNNAPLRYKQLTTIVQLPVLQLSHTDLWMVHPFSSLTVNSNLSEKCLLQAGLGSHCRKCLAPAPAPELSSVTSVAPAPAPELIFFKCGSGSGSTNYGRQRFAYTISNVPKFANDANLFV